MKYNNMSPGIFINRPNRFIAQVEIEGKEETVHVKNTGRCRELLVPGATVYVQHSSNPARKTAYDLIGVIKKDNLFNIDSQVPNTLFGEWVKSGHFQPDITRIKPEYTYGASRIDFYLESSPKGEVAKKILVEIKGVTLEKDGVATFPDAPTERGTKHIYELIQSVQEGYEAWIVFILQMGGSSYFTPNTAMDPKFSQALKNARDGGVHMMALDCIVTTDSISINQEVPIRF